MDQLWAPLALFPASRHPHLIAVLTAALGEERLGGGEESGSPQPHLHTEWQPVNPLTLNQRLRAQRPLDGCRHLSSSNYSTGGSCSGKRQKVQKAETGEMEGSWGGAQPWPQPGAGAERRRVSSIPNRWCLPLQPQLPALSDPGGPPPGLGKAWYWARERGD